MASQSYVGLPGYSFIQTSQSSNNVTGKNDPNGLIKSFLAGSIINYNGRYYLSGSVRQDATSPYSALINKKVFLVQLQQDGISVMKNLCRSKKCC